MNDEVLGMPLSIDLGEGDYAVSPVAALVIMKGIDSDGDEVHTVAMTDGLTTIDALAYAEFAKIFCEYNLRKSLYAQSE